MLNTPLPRLSTDSIGGLSSPTVNWNHTRLGGSKTSCSAGRTLVRTGRLCNWRVKSVLEQSNANRPRLVHELDGRIIQIPGYALPLEFSDAAVTEFLLVPYVGACIHSPPPPPNQIVHVHSRKGFQLSQLYMPVWVTGRMTMESSTQDAHLCRRNRADRRRLSSHGRRDRTVRTEIARQYVLCATCDFFHERARHHYPHATQSTPNFRISCTCPLSCLPGRRGFERKCSPGAFPGCSKYPSGSCRACEGRNPHIHARTHAPSCGRSPGAGERRRVP